MNDWIELNLPYNVRYSDVEFTDIMFPDCPDISKKAKEELGITPEENDNSLISEGDDRKIWREYSEKESEIDEDLFQLTLLTDISEPDLDALKIQKLKDLKNMSVDTVLKYYEYKRKYRKWQSEHPEWIEYNKQYDKIVNERKEQLKTMSFVGMGLNKVGTLIEVEIKDEDNGKVSVEQYLIGHINEHCGVCDDCVAFTNEIVKRYKIVWTPE